jgi:hypothetical protein
VKTYTATAKADNMAKLFNGTEVIEEWHPLDDVPAPRYVPATWNGPHVQTCLIEAWRVLNRTTWHPPYPRRFGATWPRYKLEWHDLLALVGGGELESMQREQNRTRILPTAREISEMEKAMWWPMTYLHDEHNVLIVNVCARVASFHGDLGREMARRRYTGNVEQWQKLNWQLCDWIANGLIVDRVTVF